MKIVSLARVILLASGSVLLSIPVMAATSLFVTEQAASDACGADEVVWVDLDHGRFYHKTQSSYAKRGNGGYACMKAAHAQYREARD